jgi:NAD(P)-dependent dehydrogenase (short-subunit alcohol dehydrogenase family)
MLCVPPPSSEFPPIVQIYHWQLTQSFLSTPLLQDWLGDDKDKRFRREVHFPTGRFGEPIEQAHAVVFLASDESSFVNGTDFVVDGGMTKVSVLEIFPCYV